MIRAQTISWYWHRLRAMDGSEIAGRIAEKTRALGERKSRAQLRDFRLGPVNPEWPRRLPDPGVASASLRAGLAEKAEAVREGRWELYGWKAVSMTDPPRWDWDAMHDRCAPLEASVAALDHRRLSGGADPRSIWEINRWSEIVVLAQNAWLNGNGEDARTAQRWLRDWMEKNQPGHGINWTSALEAGLRLINFSWIDELLRGYPDADVRCEQERLAAQIVPEHVWWVWRHRSFGSSANNHLLGELAGLVLATRRWPSLIQISCCAEKAWQQMQEQVIAQFAVDGGNLEQALHYHLFAWEMGWQTRLAMGDAKPEFLEVMTRAATYFTAMVHPDEPWDFGDSDDAEITPLTRDRSAALGEWQAWFTQKAKGESLVFWLGHPPAVSVPAEDEWRVFPESGQAIKRTGPWMARFDASPLGYGKMAAHGHLDALHVSLWHGGKAIFVDPGTGAYYSDPALRAQLAGWEAHNGPLPEGGRHAPKRMGPFLWTQHHVPPRLRIEEGDAVACFACDGPFVKRQVRLDETRFEVLDSICNGQPHQMTWTLSPDWKVQPFGGARFRLTHTDGTQFLIEFESGDTIDIECVTVAVAPHFLDSQRASALRIKFTCGLKTCLKLVA